MTYTKIPKHICKHLNLLLTVLIPFLSFGDLGIVVLKEQTSIQVSSLDLFERTELIEGNNLSDEEKNIAFRLSETEQINQLYGTFTINGKTKKIDLKSRLTTSTIDWSGFFSGAKTYAIRLPENCTFKIEFSTSSNQTIFLSTIYKNGLFDAANYTFSIDLPLGLQMSTQQNGNFQEKATFTDGTFKEKQDCIYYLIHPKNTSPEDFFSNWFELKTADLFTLNPESLPDEIKNLSKTSSKNELAKSCFNFVKEQIRYVAIENGIHAIIPRPAQQTLTNRLGDCKDMATLLLALLKQFDIEAYMSISKTNSIKDTFNFPSVGLANHMIVTAHIDGKTIFLDATEDVCQYGEPSLQILGTEAFQIGNKGNYFIHVPIELKEKPSAKFTYSFLKLNTPEQYISLSTEFNGKYNLIFSMFNRQGQLEKKTNELFSYLFPFPFIVDSIDYKSTATTIQLHAKLSRNYTIHLSEKTLIDIAFLPNISKILVGMSGDEQALFSGEMLIQLNNLKFNNIPNNLKVITVSEQENNTIFKLECTPTNTQRDGDLFSDWKTIIAKPIPFK